MKWASAVSREAHLDAALDACASSLMVDLEGESPDLVLAFASPHFASSYHRLPSIVRELLGDALILGCSGRGVIGGGAELEDEPAISLTAAILPGAELRPFRLQSDGIPDADAPPQAWEDLVGVTVGEEPHFLLLADPYSFPTDTLVAGLDYAFPQSAKIGGLVSGGSPSNHALFLDGQFYPDGAAGVAFIGNVVIDTVVAQGCRPVGRPLLVTKAQGNLLQALDDRDPMEVLRELFSSLNPSDQRLARHSLFLGVVTDPLKDNWTTGDFLIRNLLGIDPESGALAVGEYLREGQTVQFHLRDAQTSAEDLTEQLDRYAGRSEDRSAAGAVLFSCNGRGIGLYGEAGHDSKAFFSSVGSLPLGGFFCNGEIGPVGGSTYIHGYTSSFGIFRPKLFS
ncbi:MAG: Small ligand-binding sensory domain FIST [Chloroflexi bacterium]|jgi:small ligand-binding sensory domain FIST|nr:MAG: Small ligand-binding sensory domain FIST [Chloroflexota bacterium]